MKPGDEVVLMGLNGLAELKGIQEVRMEIRWVIDENFLDIVSAGCQFHDMPEDAQDQIQRLVEARAKL